MGISEWEKKDAAMWDGTRNNGSSFSPSVANDNDSTTKVTTVTEDANGNKKTVINENKTASNLMKEEKAREVAANLKMPRMIDGSNSLLFPPSITSTAREGAPQEVQERDYAMWEAKMKAQGQLLDSQGSYQPMTTDASYFGIPGERGGAMTLPTSYVGTSYPGGPTQADYITPDTPIPGNETLAGNYYEGELASDMAKKQMIGMNAKSDIFDRIEDGIMSGNLDKAEADRMKMEALADERTAQIAETSNSVFDDTPWGGVEGLAKPSSRSFWDILTLKDEIERGKNRFRQLENEDKIDATNAEIQSKNNALMSAYDAAKAAGVTVEKPETASLLDKENRTTLFGLENATPSEEENYRKIAEADRKIIATKKAINAGLDVSSTAVADAEAEVNSLRILAGELPLTTEVEAKKVIDKPENSAAKAELNNWLNAIKDPVITKEQAQESAEVMINNAVAAAPKNDGSKLKKALIIAAGSLLFGSSFLEAINAGFGVVGKEVEKDQKLAAELAKEQREIDKALKIHAGEKAIDGTAGPKFSAKPQYVNIGTRSKPVRATLTQSEGGQLYIRHAGKTVPVGTQNYSDWYTPKEQSESFRKNVDIVKKQVMGSLKETIGDRDNKQWNQTYSSALEAANQVSGALNVYKAAGINVETGMSSYTQEALESAVLAFAMYKHKIPGGKKSLKEFAQDSLIRSDMSQSLVQKDGSYLQLPDRAWVLPSAGAVGHDVGDMPEKSYAEVQSGLNSYIHTQSKKLNTKALFDMSNAQKFLLAYQAFESIEDKQPDQAAIEAGYTPFMWWLKQQRK